MLYTTCESSLLGDSASLIRPMTAGRNKGVSWLVIRCEPLAVHHILTEMNSRLQNIYGSKLFFVFFSFILLTIDVALSFFNFMSRPSGKLHA